MEQQVTPEEIVQAFCDLEPAHTWAAFRMIASDDEQPEARRVRAAAWLAIANAVSAIDPEGPDADAG